MVATFAALAGGAGVMRAQGGESPEAPAVLSAALGEVKGDFPIGRVYLDRVVVDTTRRLAPPLINRREHRFPQDWAAPNGVMTVDTDVATPVCTPGYIDCRLPNGVGATIAMSDAVINGDSARVIVRYSQVTGVVAARVTTTVETVSLRKVDGEWKVTKRKVKATA
jgi:hypothetical protein